MKKFTLINYLLAIAIGISAQQKSNMQSELQDGHRNFSEVYERLKQVNQIVNWENSKPKLKSDAISLKLDSTVNQVYNDLGSVWQKDYKDEFLYDGQMRNTEWIEREYDTSVGTTKITYKTSLMYDANSRVSTMYIYDIDSLSGELVESNKFNYFYNSDGKPDSVLTYYTEDNGVNWLLMLKQGHQYNASKQRIKTEIWNYDEDAVTLVLGGRTDFTYNGAGKIQTSTTSYLFGEIEYPFDKLEYSYNGLNQVTTIEYYGLNFLTLSLEKNGRDAFQYDSNNDLSAQIYSSWNGATWLDEDKDEFEYGSAGLSEVAFPVFLALFGEDDGYDQLKYSKAVNVINTFEMTGGNWKHTDINTFYYSGGSSTAIDDIAGADFKYYPNPTSETVTFNWKGNTNQLMLKMYRVTGAQVLEQYTWPGKAVSVSNLVNGVYFFKLMNGQNVQYSGKLVKR